MLMLPQQPLQELPISILLLRALIQVMCLIPSTPVNLRVPPFPPEQWPRHLSLHSHMGLITEVIHFTPHLRPRLHSMDRIT